MSGYYVIGRFKIAKTPTITMTIEITIAVTGRFINTSDIIS
jgi:hypothetical protein